MTVYCNEFDAEAAEWIQNLSDEGLIPACQVDCRDIREVTSDELRGYSQVHLFAGVGGWPIAFEMAGVSADESVWSGSCPCQPYSGAGKKQGDADERNLWPEMFRLVRECRPNLIFGEQVDKAIGFGWLDGICADLEGEGYAVGSIVLGAHSVSSPQIRQRIYWVGRLEHAESDGRNKRRTEPGGRSAFGGRRSGRLGNSLVEGLEGFGGGSGGEPGSGPDWRTTSSSGSWGRFDVIPCRDGRARRVESGSFPLADRIPRRLGPLLPRLGELGFDSKGARRAVRIASRNRVVRLKGYGNGIVPELAAEFIAAYLEARESDAVSPTTPS